LSSVLSQIRDARIFAGSPQLGIERGAIELVPLAH
jgi:hypothetical protein